MSVWVNPDTITGGDTFGSSNPRYVFFKGDVISEANYALRLLGGKVNFLYRNTQDTGYIDARQTTASVVAGSWQHIAVVGNSSGYTLYVNGSSAASTVTGDITQSPQINSSPLVIGRQGNSNTRMMDGLTDDIRLYNRTLTQAEITHLATSRGIEGGPTTPTTGFYNPFINMIFNNDYTRRIR